MRTVDPHELRRWLTDEGEIALVDVREEGAFGEDHLLLAVCVPLSHLELDFARLVPRRSARVVLCDNGEGLAQRAGELLEAAGYTRVHLLDGGVSGWKAAGYTTFSGVNVPSKAFGEFVEQHEGTPHIDPQALKARLEAGEKIVIVDARPLHEYRAMSIPGGIDVPGAELVYRIKALAPDPDTTVVVNCAGRTRSIIGAQSLRNAGLENPVMALENGTMGWHLAGLELEHGAERTAPEPGPEHLDWARAAAARVARRHGVRTIDRATLQAWRRDAEAGMRTLFLLDVRDPVEFEAGHLPGSVSAPGGQLVQATDRYVGTRGARLVLIDADGVRAPMTASWLRQMGWRDAVVLDGGLDGVPLEAGPGHAATLLPPPEVATIEVAELKGHLGSADVVVLDLADSLTFRDGHVPGAYWAIRSRFAHDLPGRLPRAALYVLTSPDGRLARFAAPELSALVGGEVQVLAGGTNLWLAAGEPLEAGTERALSTLDDVYYRPYDRRDAVESAMQRYLDWEVALIEKLEADGTLAFARSAD